MRDHMQGSTVMTDSEWHDLSWYQESWVPVVGSIVMVVLLIAAVVWLIDGIHKYAYWWKRNDE